MRGVSRIVPNGAAYGYVLKSTSEERLKLALRSIFIENQCVIDNEVRGMQQRSFAQASGFTAAYAAKQSPAIAASRIPYRTQLEHVVRWFCGWFLAFCWFCVLACSLRLFLFRTTGLWLCHFLLL